ncbi:MAG: hypothetical protein H7282_14550 [Cytophagaceae bacterium]|nr:hypothetical protein [Cytophagaceae bacterium]
MLNDYLTKEAYLNTDRITRCIIYLTKNGTAQLKKNLEAAQKDPRDIMLWAEYENRDHPTRVRDFDKTFKENE